MSHHIRKAAWFALLGMGAGACAADAAPNAELEGSGEQADAEVAASEDALELARIYFSDGRTIAFHEAEPGVLFTHERGLIGSPALYDREDRAELSLAELYEALAGEPAPAALVAAEARGQALRDQRAGTARPPAEPDVTTAPREITAEGLQEKIRSDLSRTEFNDRYCKLDSTWNYLHWVDVTDTGTITRSNFNDLVTAVQGIRGSVHWVVKYRPWYTWRDLMDTQVPAGSYDVVELRNYLDFDFRTTVDQAGGDLYSMCTDWK